MNKIKTTIVAALAFICLGAFISGTARAANVWTNHLHVDKIYPGYYGEVNISPVGGVPAGCNSVFRIPDDHANKKELYSMFMLSMSLGKPVAIRYNNSDDNCWVHSGYVVNN